MQFTLYIYSGPCNALCRAIWTLLSRDQCIHLYLQLIYTCKQQTTTINRNNDDTQPIFPKYTKYYLTISTKCCQRSRGIYKFLLIRNSEANCLTYQREASIFFQGKLTFGMKTLPRPMKSNGCYLKLLLMMKVVGADKSTVDICRAQICRGQVELSTRMEKSIKGRWALDRGTANHYHRSYTVQANCMLSASMCRPRGHGHLSYPFYTRVVFQESYIPGLHVYKYRYITCLA